MRTPVWIDSDLSVDDLLSVTLAGYDARARLLGISTVYGSCSAVEKATEVALDATSSLGLGHLPVVQGAAKPLVRPPLSSSSNDDGHDGAASSFFPPSGKRAVNAKAVSFMFQAIRQHREATGQKVTLVCLGPLTNCGLLLSLFPEISSDLAGIVVSGGSIVGGDVTSSAEFNFHCDPEAASSVLSEAPRMGVPVTLVPLDATRQAVLTPQVLACLAWGGSFDVSAPPAGPTNAALFSSSSSSLSSATRMVETASTPLRKAMMQSLAAQAAQASGGSSTVTIHEPAAVLFAINRDLFASCRCKVDVDAREGSSLGQSVIDLENRGNHSTEARNVEVAFALKNTDELWRSLLIALAGADARSPLNGQSSGAAQFSFGGNLSPLASPAQPQSTLVHLPSSPIRVPPAPAPTPAHPHQATATANENNALVVAAAVTRAAEDRTYHLLPPTSPMRDTAATGTAAEMSVASSSSPTHSSPNPISSSTAAFILNTTKATDLLPLPVLAQRSAAKAANSAPAAASTNNNLAVSEVEQVLAETISSLAATLGSLNGLASLRSPLALAASTRVEERDADAANGSFAERLAAALDAKLSGGSEAAPATPVAAPSLASSSASAEPAPAAAEPSSATTSASLAAVDDAIAAAQAALIKAATLQQVLLSGGGSSVSPRKEAAMTATVSSQSQLLPTSPLSRTAQLRAMDEAGPSNPLPAVDDSVTPALAAQTAATAVEEVVLAGTLSPHRSKSHSLVSASPEAEAVSFSPVPAAAVQLPSSSPLSPDPVTAASLRRELVGIGNEVEALNRVVMAHSSSSFSDAASSNETASSQGPAASAVESSAVVSGTEEQQQQPALSPFGHSKLGLHLPGLMPASLPSSTTVLSGYSSPYRVGQPLFTTFTASALVSSPSAPPRSFSPLQHHHHPHHHYGGSGGSGMASSSILTPSGTVLVPERAAFVSKISDSVLGLPTTIRIVHADGSVNEATTCGASGADGASAASAATVLTVPSASAAAPGSDASLAAAPAAVVASAPAATAAEAAPAPAPAPTPAPAVSVTAPAAVSAAVSAPSSSSPSTGTGAGAPKKWVVKTSVPKRF